MFSEIVKKSFNLWWKNKRLWIVGILSAITYSGTIQSNLMTELGKKAGTLGVSELVLFISVFALILILINFAYILSIGLLSEIGQIKAYRDLYEGKSVGGVVDIIKSGSKYWGKMILLSLAFILPVIFIVVIVVIFFAIILGTLGLGTASAGQSSSSNLLAGIGALALVVICCLSIVFIILAALWGVHFSFAKRVMILQDKGVMDSIKISFHFIKNNFWKIVSAYLVMICIMILILIVLAIPGIIVLVAWSAFSFLFQQAIIGIGLTMPLIGAFMYLVLEIVSAILVSIYAGIDESFTQAYWNVVYLDLLKAENHLVNGEPEKENLGQVKSVSKSVESQVQN